MFLVDKNDLKADTIQFYVLQGKYLKGLVEAKINRLLCLTQTQYFFLIKQDRSLTYTVTTCWNAVKQDLVKQNFLSGQKTRYLVVLVHIFALLI